MYSKVSINMGPKEIKKKLWRRHEKRKRVRRRGASTKIVRAEKVGFWSKEEKLLSEGKA